MNIGVFFGSRSPEHDVSIITGELVISGLKSLGYPVTPIYIGKDGRWYSDEKLSAIQFFQNPEKNRLIKKFGALTLDVEKSVGKLVLKRKGLGGKAIAIDFAFPAIHGANGEDGTIQGLFEIFNIPYAGCDVTSSALTMDKILTKLLLQQQKIPTPEFVFFDRRDWLKNEEVMLASISKLSWPVFVKPPRLGSSIGISKAKNQKELEFGIEVALHYGDQVLVEEGVENLMDITCFLIVNSDPVPSLLQESVFGSELFSYEEKYLKGGGAQLGKAKNNLVIPARLDEKTTNAIQETAKQVFKTTGCSGIGRVDFLYDKKTGKFYVSEVNTLPGTLYHHLWKATGWDLSKVLSELIRLGMEKYASRNKLTATFESDILTKANFTKLKIDSK